jgi:hypothetical protein
MSDDFFCYLYHGASSRCSGQPCNPDHPSPHNPDDLGIRSLWTTDHIKPPVVLRETSPPRGYDWCFLIMRSKFSSQSSELQYWRKCLALFLSPSSQIRNGNLCLVMTSVFSVFSSFVFVKYPPYKKSKVNSPLCTSLKHVKERKYGSTHFNPRKCM